MNVKDKEYEDRTKEERRLRMEAKNEAIRKEDMAKEYLFRFAFCLKQNPKKERKYHEKNY